MLLWSIKKEGGGSVVANMLLWVIVSVLFWMVAMLLLSV